MIKRIVISALLIVSPLLLLAQDGQRSGMAMLLEVKGAIGPATSDYVHRSLEKAAAQNAELIIVQMDTPGGLDTAMREIIKDIVASPVPVVSYVAPSGARAASAGTYILYASHVAAMAPATNLGAATPVQIATPITPSSKPGGDEKGAEGGAAGDPMSNKIINDAVAYIRGLAQMRGRNAEWAERAVREAASLAAEEALAEGVIDIVASDLSELLVSLDGRTINVLGQERTLSTAHLTLQRLEPDWRSRLLAIITDPNIAYVLMLVGVYGLIYEFANPGMILPGVVGAISLFLALFAFQVLPINYAGLGLMLLGIAFMIGEVFVPSFGALGIGGMIAFVIGSIILLDTDVPGYGISWPLIAAFALVNAGFFMVVVGMAIKARRRPVVSGREELVGGSAEVIDSVHGRARVRVHGETWQARSHTPLHRGQLVRVTAVQGLTLWVEPTIEPQSLEESS